MSNLYVFGYLSLLSADSVKSTLGVGQMANSMTPIKVRGYRRTWTSERDATSDGYKKYVTLNDLEAVDRYCWATIEESEKSKVNGLLSPVTLEGLQNMDSREVGYERVDVTDLLEFYPGYEIDGKIQVFAYIAPNTLTKETSFIDINYVNMGLEGAQMVDQSCKGFYDDYINSTDDCASEMKEIYMVFMSYDGKSMYLLNRLNTEFVKIHAFKNLAYKRRQKSDPYESQGVCRILFTKDIRNIVAGDAGENSIAYYSTGRSQLEGFVNKEDKWLDLVLLRNKNLPDDLLQVLLSRVNWIGKLIAFDLGYVSRDDCEYWAEGFSRI